MCTESPVEFQWSVLAAKDHYINKVSAGQGLEPKKAGSELFCLLLTRWQNGLIAQEHSFLLHAESILDAWRRRC